MTKYKKIASRFCIGNALKEYQGAVIASDQAFFLLIDRSEFESIGSSLAIAGIPGVLSAAKLLSKRNEPVAIEYEMLPEEIVNHPDWPIKRSSARVIVLPNDSVAGLNSKYWGAPLMLESGGQTYFASINFLSWSKIIKHLQANGWAKQFETGTSSAGTGYEAPMIGLILGALAALSFLKLTEAREIAGAPVELVAGALTVVCVLAGLFFAHLRK